MMVNPLLYQPPSPSLPSRKRRLPNNNDKAGAAIRETASSEEHASRKRPRTSSSPLSSSSNSKQQRVVQFGDKDEIIELIRPSSEMTPEERSAAWYHKSDFRSSLQMARMIGQAMQFTTDSDLYIDTLANTYAFCCMDVGGDSFLPPGIADELEMIDQVGEQLAFVAGATGDEMCHRGLERMTVPLIGLEIVRRRKLAIASVVLAQKSLGVYLPQGTTNNRAEQSELLRLLSENETKPARKFAKAMGVVDAMGALVEYQQLQDC